MNHNRAISEAAWPPHRVETLRFYIEAGMHSFKEIGGLMAITKNAAIGKARRLDITGPRSTGSTAAAAPSTLFSRLDALDVFHGFGRCAFPIGDPRADGFHICGDAVPAEDVLSPYCANHQRIACLSAGKRTDNATRPVERRRSA